MLGIEAFAFMCVQRLRNDTTSRKETTHFPTGLDIWPA
ncbi:MAG: hypothetical protein RL145_1365 [Pseudomonadota bacterium]|jgi:hypothetical protein